MKNTEEISILRSEYDELIEDAGNLEKIFRWVERKSFIDAEGRYCLSDPEFMNVLQIIGPDRLEEIENSKRETFEKLKEEAKKIAEKELEKKQEEMVTEEQITPGDDENEY